LLAISQSGTDEVLLPGSAGIDKKDGTGSTHASDGNTNHTKTLHLGMVN